ncbi:hypothetical protein B0H19DRAFT_1256237 [Mycena capillaripes]|nr:hypothetical protein B0H19DRAFT_1256237 [Mycena capillaripes]
MSSTNRHTQSSKQNNYPLVLPAPKENINQHLDESLLPIMHVSELAVCSDEDLYELGPRTLIGLKDYVSDVTALQEVAGLKPGPFRVYASKDISYALAKYSTEEEDVNVVGYANLSLAELEVLDKWVSIFLKRFEVVGSSVAATSTPSHFEVEVAADLSRVKPSHHCDSG